MILEVAVLDVVRGLERSFEEAFSRAIPLLSGQRGYVSHSIRRCVEREGRYLLLVEWERLDDHTLGFRGSAEYGRWKELLHRFYDPFPEVMHYGEPL